MLLEISSTHGIIGSTHIHHKLATAVVLDSAARMDPLWIEAEASRRLYHERTGRSNRSRRLHHPPPAVQETTQHGMMIDA